MQPIRLFVKETDGISRSGEPVSRGVPIPCGAVTRISQLQLVDESGSRIDRVQMTPLGRWHDGSLKWVRLEFAANVERNTTSEYLLKPGTDVSGVSDRSHDWAESDEKISLLHPDLSFSLEKTTGEVTVGFPGSTKKNGFTLSCLEKATNNSVVQRKVTATILSAGPFRYELEVEIELQCTSQKLSIVVIHRYLIFPCLGLMRLEHCVHNPSAAEHRGGLWDLGDKNAFQFSNTGYRLSFTDAVNRCGIQSGVENRQREFSGSDSISVYQESSGGENWNSENHVDRTGRVAMTRKGYDISCNGHTIDSSSRAEPIFTLHFEEENLCVVPAYFWQNNPTEVCLEGKQMEIRLFTAAYPGVQELQPGEKKTREVNLLFSNAELDSTALLRPVVVSFLPEHWLQCAVSPFAGCPDIFEYRNPLNKVLCEPATYHGTRECIDEYGWRHFGEVVADHESLYSSDGMLVSHYNNQYDPIQGFAVRFLYTSDNEWFRLFDELARHVVDIDIYHTCEDRSEYNNGLFWHTDHYLPAITATHRTFSKHNKTSSTAGQTGGGPGTEHCYSYGLMLHYYLTGRRESADGVLKLANWMLSLHEDDSCMLANVNLAYKRDVRRLLQLQKTGICQRHIYPFTRGTGNYISCLIDAYELSSDISWLHKAEEVIASTIHPSDDIEARRLKDIEGNWSYTVLLLSIAKYLWHKRSISNNDEQYEYAKSSFLAYAQWMLNNESTYLSQVDQLEFPNDTWVAQEIRKSNILAIAGYLDLEKRTDYYRRSRYFLEYVCDTLSGSEQKRFARIQAILMQNYGPQYLTEYTPNGDLAVDEPNTVNAEIPALLPVTKNELILNILKRLFIGVRKFSLFREINWLKRRVFS